MLTVFHAEESDVAALAEMLDELDRFYGAVKVPPRSDREMEIRRALFADPSYSKSESERVFDVVHGAAEARLASGTGVIVDATHLVEADSVTVPKGLCITKNHIVPNDSVSSSRVYVYPL